MPYIDLYGRSMDPRATFEYPSTTLPLPRAPKLFLTLPAAANRIFGEPSQRMVSIDETRVQLDPTSIYEYTERNKGLGGLGGLGNAKTPDEIFAEKKLAKERFKELHPELTKTPGIVTDLMSGNPWVAGGIILAAVAALMTGVKAFSSIFGSK